MKISIYTLVLWTISMSLVINSIKTLEIKNDDNLNTKIENSDKKSSELPNRSTDTTITENRQQKLQKTLLRLYDKKMADVIY